MNGERKYTGFAAIYQLEQEKLRRDRNPPPAPASEPAARPAEEPSSAAPPSEEVREEPGLPPAEQAQSSLPVAEAAPPPPTRLVRNPRPTSDRTSPVRRPRRNAPTKTSKRRVAAAAASDSPVDAHAAKWKQVYRLSKGELSVLKVMFALSHGRGVDTCYIKIGEVAEAAGLKRRRCQYVIRSLEILGFLDRLGEYDPANGLGLEYRMHLTPPHNDIE